MAAEAGKRLGLLRRVAHYIPPTQRDIIYKSMVRSKMEYTSSVWMGSSATVLERSDAIQRRALKIINLPKSDESLEAIQHINQCRNVGRLHIYTVYITNRRHHS
jgi:hypothetical protein